ncbi:hypothetical protein ACVWXU_000630 [Streptomyces sp. TE33382]
MPAGGDRRCGLRPSQRAPAPQVYLRGHITLTKLATRFGISGSSAHDCTSAVVRLRANAHRVADSRADCSPSHRRHGVHVQAVTGRQAYTFVLGSPEQALVLIPRVVLPNAELVDPDCYIFVGFCARAEPVSEVWRRPPSTAEKILLVPLGTVADRSTQLLPTRPPRGPVHAPPAPTPLSPMPAWAVAVSYC